MMSIALIVSYRKMSVAAFSLMTEIKLNSGGFIFFVGIFSPMWGGFLDLKR